MEQAGSEAIPPPQTQTEPDPAGLTATKLRKRKADKPEKTSSEKPKPEEIEEKNPLDESSQREVGFLVIQLLAYRAKAEPFTQKWREKVQELINIYLQPTTKPDLTPEELGKGSQAIQTKLANQPVTPDDQRILYLTVGWIIDGSTHPLAELATLVRTHLAELGIDTSALAEGWPDLLITHLALKEDLSHIPKPPDASNPGQAPALPSHFWQPLTFPDLLPPNYASRSSLRSKLVSSLETLSKLLVQLHKCPNTQAGLQRLVEQEKKHLAAEHKVDKEREKQRGEEEKRRKDEEKREEKRRAEEEKEEKRRAEEGRKEEKKRLEEEKKRVEEEKKEEKRRAEEEKKRLEEEKKEEKRKAEEEKKEEKKKLEDERKRLDELRKEEKRKLEEERKAKEEEEKRKKHGKALTTFFTPISKEANSLANSGIGLPGEPQEGPPPTTAASASIWKQLQGVVPRYSQWSEERCESFLSGLKNCLSSDQIRPSIQLLRSDLMEQLMDLNKSKPGKFLEGEMMCEDGPKPRRVFIKYEDYLKASYEYTGMFKRRSPKIRPTEPFAKDDELIDYELSSEDELELQEEAESLNSKEEDAGEEEELEDGDDFVVPDGYLSASEVESLDGQDKQKLLQRKANNPRNLAKKVPHHIDFTTYTRGEDCSLDDLADRLRVVGIFPNTFPLAIEIEPEVVPGAPEITDEQLVEIVKAIHCCSNKLEEIEKLRKKFGTIPKSMIKNKVDDITTAGILVDPELYEKNGSNTDDYLKDITVLFLKREEEEEIEGAVPATDAETQKKERLTRGGEKLDGERLWQLAKSLNGSREGLTKKENKILTEFQRKHATLTRREIDRRAKENALNLYLVDPMVFESLNIKEEFLGAIRATFRARVPPIPEAPELPEPPKEVVEKPADKSSAEKTSDKKKPDQVKPASPLGKESVVQSDKVLQFSEAKVARPTHKHGKKPEEDELRELQPKEVVAVAPEPVKGPKQVSLSSFFNGKQETAHPEPLPAEKENKRKRK